MNVVLIATAGGPLKLYSLKEGPISDKQVISVHDIVILVLYSSLTVAA